MPGLYGHRPHRPPEGLALIYTIVPLPYWIVMQRFRVLVGHYAPHLGVTVMAAFFLTVGAAALVLPTVVNTLPEGRSDWLWSAVVFSSSSLIALWLGRQHAYHNRRPCPRCDHLGRKHALRGRRGPATAGQALTHLRDSGLALIIILVLALASVVAMWFIPWAIVTSAVFMGLSYFAAASHQASSRSCPHCPPSQTAYFRATAPERWCNESRLALKYYEATRGADTVLVRCEDVSQCDKLSECCSSFDQALSWMSDHSVAAHSYGHRLVKFSFTPNASVDASSVVQEQQ